MLEERSYWLGFSAFPGIGPARFKKLLVEFGSAKDAWEASGPHPFGSEPQGRRLEKLIGEETAEKFDKFRSEFSIDNYLKKLKEKEVWFITLQDKDYPQILREIKNPPFVLYGKGNLDSRSPIVVEDKFRGNDGKGGNDKFSSRQNGYQTVTRQAQTIMPTIAVVGTRKSTQYGREVTRILTAELSANGFTIVSGLALGIDAVSHKTALENNGSPSGEAGKTIAVLGCGVDCCFPTENQSIYNSIVKNGGCIVSEYPLAMKPARWTFPARNRIIAGLSQAVLVTEGAEDSGSLITANFALKFNRKVFAVPGPITSKMSKGPYKLIAKGAKLVTSAEDIFKELKTQSPIQSGTKLKTTAQKSKVGNATKEEQKILDLLQNEPLHFDEIVRTSGLQSSQISSILSIMEIKGMIKSLDGGMFGIAS